MITNNHQLNKNNHPLNRKLKLTILISMKKDKKEQSQKYQTEVLKLALKLCNFN